MDGLGYECFFLSLEVIRKPGFVSILLCIYINSFCLTFHADIADNSLQPLAHLVVHWAETREVVSSRLRLDQHSGSLNNCGEKCCLCNSIYKWLDFLVFSDKVDKPEVPSHNSLNVDNSVGR